MQQNHRPWPKHRYKHSAHVSCTNRTTDPGHSTGTNIQPMCLVPTEAQTLAKARVQTFSPCLLYAATLNCLLPINPAMKIKHWHFMPHHFAVHATMQNQLSLLLSSTFFNRMAVGVSRGSVHSNSFRAQLGNWSKKWKHTHQVPVHVKHHSILAQTPQKTQTARITHNTTHSIP